MRVRRGAGRYTGFCSQGFIHSSCETGGNSTIVDGTCGGGDKMNVADVAVATMTKVRARDEEGLIAGALARLSRTSMPIAVADGGSPRRFVDNIGQLHGVTLVAPRHQGLVGQVQASMKKAHATGRPFILFTEPDKRGFFDRAAVDFIRHATEDAGIVLAARSAAGFRTFPPFQRLAESAANQLCGRVTGIDTDYFYGPFLLHRRLAAEIGRAPRTLGWGWRPFLFATAHRLGYRIATVVGDYRCPPAQRQEDDAEKEHRVRQLAENALGILAAIVKR